MAKTVKDLIKHALQDGRVLPVEGRTVSAEQEDRALTALNDMLHEWEADDIDLGHSTLGINDTMPYPDTHTLGIQTNLALYLARIFQVPIRPDLINEAGEMKDNLREFYDEPPVLSVDAGLHPYYNPNRRY